MSIRYLHHIRVMAATVALVTLLGGMPASVIAQPVGTGEVPTQHVAVSLSFPAPSVAPTDTFRLTADTSLSAPAEYFEVRVRVWRPSGALLYQKTEVRHDVEAGTVPVAFERELKDLSVTPGRYPVEIRVLASGSEATLVSSRLLVAETGQEPLPVVVVARLGCSPALDPSGRFALDPDTQILSRQAADDLVGIASRRAEGLTLAIPPLLLEEWSRASSGYQLSVPEGVRDVAADTEAAQRYRATIDGLATAVQGDRIELLDVPYADPDVAGLTRIDALDDLARHYSVGRSIYATVLGDEPSSGTALHGDTISETTAKIMAETDHDHIICSPTSVDETATSGVYRDSGTGATLLVTDPVLASLLTSGTADDIYDRLYDATYAAERPDALVVVLDIGPGQDHDAADVERLLGLIDSAGWVEATTAARAARLDERSAVDLVSDDEVPLTAPVGYWSDVAEAHDAALALEQAWGAEDPASVAALSAMLISQSACWKGPDDSYPFADRGRAFATSVTRTAQDVFSGIQLEARDVTLAARSGDVPLTVFSAADRPLTLRIETLAGSSTPRSTEATVSIKPADNFLTIPVDLGSSVADELTVRIMAGDVLVAETTVTVRASYLDRLTTMVTVVLVLVVLLLFIRRRVKQADAGNMRVGTSEDGD